MSNKKCHFIGIGGIGMSGLARILLSRNVQVSGSDLTASYVTHGLEKAGAKIFMGHSPNHISTDMTVIYTSDIKANNPELEEAQNLQCPMLHRSDLLQELMSEYKTLAVAGTHGKTTTTALLTSVLIEAGLDPSFAVGGFLPQLQTNAANGKGEFFVAEADESDGTFLKYHPWGAIVTNIDCDHMDYFRSEEALIESFSQFMNKIESPSRLFWCGDDARLRSLNKPGFTYGFSKECDFRITNFRQMGWKIWFDIENRKQSYINIEVSLTGQHNALNAAAVFALSLCAGVREAEIRKAFQSFKGVLRRCEVKGEFHGVLLLDDYAHHPAEIKTTLKAIKSSIQERRLIAVFQPHRYTRTRDCLGQYGKIFDAADQLVVTEIYGARETPIPGLSSRQIVEEVEASSSIPCLYIPRLKLAEELAAILRPHDVVVGMGAGDITKLSQELQVQMQATPPKPYKVGLIYGGRSAEHEVSISSANYIGNSLNLDYYNTVRFRISREGIWSLGDEMPRKNSMEALMDDLVLKELLACEVFFPVLHGPYGEDGTIQGFFDMLGKAYVGCDHRSAAICMDKAVTKKLMLVHGIPTIPFVDFSKEAWSNSPETILKNIKMQLAVPFFVKPVHLGSSIGVSRVDRFEDLAEAIEHAFEKDWSVIVENGLDIREIEFAVLGNHNRVSAFPPCEILAKGQLLSYEGKYGQNAMECVPRADLPPSLIEEGIVLAEMAYKAVGCTGMARVDFFLDKSNKFWLNEINPIPGFTPTSAFPKICMANGLGIGKLIDRLINLALDRRRKGLA